MRKIDPYSADSLEEYEFFRYLQRKESAPVRKMPLRKGTLYAICLAVAAVIVLLSRLF